MGFSLGSLGALGGGVLGAVLGGPAGAAVGASIGGGLGGSFDAESSAKELNTRQQELAQGQMDFQERMSSTAHQREVKDLVAAGLNPVLSAGGGGASSAAGTMAVLQNPQESKANVLSKVMTSAKAIKELGLTDELSKTEKSKQALNNTEANKAFWETVQQKNSAMLSDMKTEFLQDNPWLIKGEAVGDILSGFTGSARDLADTFYKIKRSGGNMSTGGRRRN